jgi:hypothetical protein
MDFDMVASEGQMAKIAKSFQRLRDLRQKEHPFG